MKRWGRTRDNLIDIAAHERRRRIIVSVAAWAYENNMKPIMSDGEYDALASSVNPNIATGNHRLDAFFKRHFDPSTGMWVHKHPNMEELAGIYYRVHYPTLYADEIKRARKREKRRERKAR
jgi:hypothetical protein